ncbi:MAG: RNA methyltransferase [Microbacteriaceae bacterium]|nr:RNA methyltransferase [Microbacteriaceae bacterium]
MIDNPRSPRVRAVAKLAKRKGRAETGLFLAEGPQAVGEALAYRPDGVVALYAVAEALALPLARAAVDAGIEVTEVTAPVLEAMCDTVTPQGVLAVCRQPATTLDELLAGRPALVAILDEVRDPGNAGTVIRAADAAGAAGVILTGPSVDAFNPKVVRSTTGSIFHVPVVQGVELEPALDAVRAAGLRVLAADVTGEELPVVQGLLADPTAWLFGNEAHGLSDAHLAMADRAIRVPIYGKAESLNLATAASVCLYASAFAHRG